MAEFEQYVGKERERLSQRRDELMQQRDEIDRQLDELEREFGAITAYEQARKGQGASAPARGSKRRTGVRQIVLDVVKKHPKGISRADILQEMKAKGDKRAEQSISNALSNLKKQNSLKLEDGSYIAAG